VSEATAKKWVVISALGVFGIWWYRRWREGTTAVLEAPKFIAAWGTVYFVISLVTEAAPALGGSFSMLVLVGDALGNAMPAHGGGLLADVTGQQKGKPAAGSPTGGWGTQTQPVPSTTPSPSPAAAATH
jgi:hypothetical protein